VQLAAGREGPAEIIGADPRHDVVVLKTPETGASALPVRGEDLAAGDEVYAVGSPFALVGTVTRGIVSGYRVVDGKRLIQSDVTVQPGNSGGPLVDAAGNVIGLAVARITARGESTGLNFFVPIADAMASVGLKLETRQR